MLPHACELFNTVAGCWPGVAAAGREPHNDGSAPQRAHPGSRENMKIDKGYLIVRTISYRNHQT